MKTAALITVVFALLGPVNQATDYVTRLQQLRVAQKAVTCNYEAIAARHQSVAGRYLLQQLDGRTLEDGSTAAAQNAFTSCMQLPIHQVECEEFVQCPDWTSTGGK